MKKEELIRSLRRVSMPPEKKAHLAEKLASDIQEQNSARIMKYQKTAIHKERSRMMLKSKKRIGGLIAVAVMVLGMTAFATTGIISNWYSSSSSRPDYRVLPTAEQVNRDIGYDVTIPEGFSNGYVFHNGSILKNKLTDDSGNTVEKFKSVVFRYKKGKDEVEFSQERYQSDTEKEGNVVDTVNGTELWYHSYVNKIVPPDYQLTEEDRKAEENGDLIFSYGSDQVEMITWQSLSWNADNLNCQFFQEVKDGSLSEQELIEMAREILE